MVSSADSNGGLYCCFACESPSGSPGIRSTVAALAWPVRQPGRRCVALRFPGRIPNSTQLREGALGPSTCASGFPARTTILLRRCLLKSFVLLDGSLSPISCGNPQPLTLCALQLRFASSPVRLRSGMIASTQVRRTTHGTSEPFALRTVRYYAGRPGSASRRRNTGKSDNRNCTRVQTGRRLPGKAIGPSPLPGRWPSAPNGQTLASRMAPSCGRPSRRSRLRRGNPSGGGSHLLPGASTSQSPNIRRSESSRCKGS